MKVFFKDTEMKSIVAVKLLSIDKTLARIIVLDSKGNLYSVDIVTDIKTNKDKELKVTPLKLEATGCTYQDVYVQ